jgi:hypothetical protein
MLKSRQNNFQHNRPVFCKTPFRSNAKNYKRGDEYPWQTLGVDIDKVTSLYTQGYIHHHEENEEKSKGVIGDGLTELSMDELNLLVKSINKTVESKAVNKTEFIKKKVPSSKLKDKQIGYIRRWRMTYGHME